MASLNEVLNEIEKICKEYANKSADEKLKVLDKVGKLRGAIFKEFRGKKMSNDVKEALRKLGKVFPPTLYKLRKKK
ncbi:MAG: hypothetical protein ABGW69_03415 [Nanoarchaeota archaeon]